MNMENTTLPSEHNEPSSLKYHGPKVDLNFVTDGTIDRICSQRTQRHELLQECFKHNIKRAFDYAEAALDHCGSLQRAGFGTIEELDEAEVLLKAFLVQVMALRRAQGGE